MNIHQLCCTRVNGVTNGDHAAVVPLGDVVDQRAEAVTLVVADGGHSSTTRLSTGRLCAVMWARECQDAWRTSISATSSDRVRSVMNAALRRTNRALFERGLSEEPVRDRSASIAAAVIHRGVMIYTHLGNVRVLLYRDGLFTRLTEDHTLSRSLAARGLLRHREGRHPYSDLVNRRLGMGAEVPFRSRTLILRPNDLILVMSDGMGELRRSSVLNQMFQPLVREWADQEIAPDEVPLLIASHLRFHVADALERTRDDATCLALAISQEDLVQPVVPADVLAQRVPDRSPSLFDN